MTTINLLPSLRAERDLPLFLESTSPFREILLIPLNAAGTMTLPRSLVRWLCEHLPDGDASYGKTVGATRVSLPLFPLDSTRREALESRFRALSAQLRAVPASDPRHLWAGLLLTPLRLVFQAHCLGMPLSAEKSSPLAPCNLRILQLRPSTPSHAPMSATASDDPPPFPDPTPGMTLDMYAGVRALALKAPWASWPQIGEAPRPARRPSGKPRATPQPHANPHR